MPKAPKLLIYLLSYLLILVNCGRFGAGTKIQKAFAKEQDVPMDMHLL